MTTDIYYICILAKKKRVWGHKHTLCWCHIQQTLIVNGTIELQFSKLLMEHK